MDPRRTTVTEIFVVDQTTEVKVTLVGVPNGSPDTPTPAVFLEERVLTGNGALPEFRPVVSAVRARSLLRQMPPNIGALRPQLEQAGFFPTGPDAASAAALLFAPAATSRPAQ